MSPHGACANCDARNYALRSRTRFATQMTFSKARRGGRSAYLAAQVLSAEAKRMKRARAAGVAGVDENAPPFHAPTAGKAKADARCGCEGDNGPPAKSPRKSTRRTALSPVAGEESSPGTSATSVASSDAGSLLSDFEVSPSEEFGRAASWQHFDKGAPATFDETTRSTHGLVNSSPGQFAALDSSLDSFDFDEAGVVSCLQMGALSLFD